MNNKYSPVYTLRAHKSGITCLKLIPSNTVPLLLSGDSDGQIYLWDLISRRPVAFHSLDSHGSIISLDYKDEIFIIQSKDNSLRLMRLDSDPGAVQWGSTQTLRSLSQVYEIPINTLNFANIAVEKICNDQYRLWCCNTMHSECIDVYTFNLDNEYSLKRQFNNLDFYDMVKKVANDDSIFQFEKLGIIMKIIEHDGVIYLGYESGVVLGLRLRMAIDEGKTRSNKQNGELVLALNSGVSTDKRCIVELAYISAVHYPNPVLSLFFSEERNMVLSGSTESEVGLHNFTRCKNYEGETTEPTDNLTLGAGIVKARNLGITNKAMKLPTTKIGHIDTIENNIVVSNWQGETLVTNGVTVLHRFSKAKSNVCVDESSLGTFTQKEQESPVIKVGAMLCLYSNDSIYHSLSSPGERRRVAKINERNWCLIGYEDGSIVMQGI